MSDALVNRHPETGIADVPMHWRQVAAVVVCGVLTGLDGFDVLAISFAAPGIAAEWGINRATLGVVLSIELFGMALGSVLFGNIADRAGRRPTILACLSMMAAGMFAASFAASIPALAVARLLTGLGIGGMLSSTSAIVAEVSNDRRRDLNLSLNIAGYPGGAILGGSLASLLLSHNGNWRSVFQVGSVATLLALPMAWLFVQESIGFLLARQPNRALERLNRILASFSHKALDSLPPLRARASRAPIGELFSRQYARATILLTATYLAQIMVFYFIQKWLPKIVVDMGHSAGEAGAVLVSANIGCLLGALAIGLASQRFRVDTLIVGAMTAAFFCVAAVGMAPWSLSQMAAVCFLAGFFINAAVVGLYPVMARSFPAEVRASGIGFAIGVGRGGAALGPMAAGALFSWGYSLKLVSVVMGSGALAAAIFLLMLARAQASGPVNR